MEPPYHSKSYPDNEDPAANSDENSISQQSSSGQEADDVEHSDVTTTSSTTAAAATSSVKLFIGQVPRTSDEERLFPIFEPFGPIKELTIIRDKSTGQHRGCAFITYFQASSANAAVAALDNQVTLNESRNGRPLQVRIAKDDYHSSNSNHNSSNIHNNHPDSNVVAQPENKLFIGMIANLSEDSLHQLFMPYGEITEVYMIRNSDGTNKGCAFLKYATRASSLEAISELNGRFTIEGAARPMIVKFADQKRGPNNRSGGNHSRRRQPYKQQQQIMDSNSYHYPHTATGAASPQSMYGAAAAYYNTTPAPPYPGMMHPYGTVQRDPIYAATAHMYTQQQHLHPPPQSVMNMPPQRASTTTSNSNPKTSKTNPNSNSETRPQEGPPGANLFIYHLPHDLTDADLATLFDHYGNVISAKVYVDKYTGESKGFGFVSYDSPLSANGAIEQMNGFQIGNKRLKVQHKRVHPHNSYNNMNVNPANMHVHHNYHVQQQQQYYNSYLQQQSQQYAEGFSVEDAMKRLAINSNNSKNAGETSTTNAENDPGQQERIGT